MRRAGGLPRRHHVPQPRAHLAARRGGAPSFRFRWSSFADSGLLLNYGPNLRDIYVRLASYVDRILRDTPPGELPVEEPRSIELVVNLRTARALGIEIAQPVLVRADRVIE